MSRNYFLRLSGLAIAAMHFAALGITGCGADKQVGNQNRSAPETSQPAPLQTQSSQNQPAKVESPSLQRAKDGSLYWADRIKAASELNEEERTILREYLTDIVRKVGCDVGMKDAVTVLGEVGNAETVRVLEEISRLPIEIPGRINLSIRITTQEIRKHLGMPYTEFRPLEPSPSVDDMKPTPGL